jgi:wyosine [tRNA(Phe)-imidazoG37] synthetase (radical SAM superfamily)
MLTVSNHSRDRAGLTYVYPVISRRANGLSIGINLNPNNACNWRCIYCQVPDLVRGSAPAIDLELLNKELFSLIGDVQHGDFYGRFEVSQQQRQIRDIAISGNGEPTSSREFHHVVMLLGDVVKQVELLGNTKIVLISNGSLMHQAHVQIGLDALSQLRGEVWFKLDCATDSGMQQINNAAYSLKRVKRNLGIVVKHCPVWIQTSLFAIDGQLPATAEWQAYLDFLDSFRNNVQPHQQPRGVLLYGLARPSMQPEAARLKSISEGQMQAYADTIRALGYQVNVSC